MMSMVPLVRLEEKFEWSFPTVVVDGEGSILCFGLASAAAAAQIRLQLPEQFCN